MVVSGTNPLYQDPPRIGGLFLVGGGRTGQDGSNLGQFGAVRCPGPAVASAHVAQGLTKAAACDTGFQVQVEAELFQVDQVRVGGGSSLVGGFVRSLDLGGQIGVSLVAFLGGFLVDHQGDATVLGLGPVTEGLDRVTSTVLVIPGEQGGEGGSVQVRAGFHVSLQGGWVVDEFIIYPPRAK